MGIHNKPLKNDSTSTYQLGCECVRTSVHVAANGAPDILIHHCQLRVNVQIKITVSMSYKIKTETN